MEAPYQAPHLLIHFDINGTLTLKDSTKTAKDGKKVSNEYMILSALAESTAAIWDPNYPNMPFKDYVYTVLAPGDKNDAEVKEKRQNIIANFLPWLEEHHHPARFKVRHEYDLLRKYQNMSESEFKVFDSFYTLIQKLIELDIPHTIILRTFGNDLNQVIDEIEHNPRELKIKFGTLINLKETSVTVEKANTLFHTFLNSLEHIAVQDDWAKWAKDYEYAQSGKPFMYDSTGCLGRKNLSLFFDDKITGKMQDIVNPIEVSGKPTATKLKGRLTFHVNTTKAAIDEQYFVKKVLKALAMHE